MCWEKLQEASADSLGEMAEGEDVLAGGIGGK